MKKMIKITSIVLIVIAALAIIYLAWIYILQPTTEPLSINGPPTQETAPATGAENPQKLSEKETFDYWVKTNGEIYLADLDGKFYRISPAGTEEKISDQAIQGLSQIKSSSDGSKAIISFGYPFQETFTVFNTSDKSWQALPAGTSAAAWHPTDSDQLAILKTNGDQTSLSLFTLSNKKSKEVIRLAQQDFNLDWISKDEIYLTDRSSAAVKSSLWAVNIAKKTLRRLINEKLGLLVKWFEKGEMGLKFVSANRGGVLETIDKNGGVLASLSIVTLPEKCTADKNNIYCSSSSGFSDKIMPDEYFKQKSSLAETIYKIPRGLEQISISIYTSSIGPTAVDVRHLEIKNGRLIFINRFDDKLYDLVVP